MRIASDYRVHIVCSRVFHCIDQYGDAQTNTGVKLSLVTLLLLRLGSRLRFAQLLSNAKHFLVAPDQMCRRATSWYR